MARAEVPPIIGLLAQVGRLEAPLMRAWWAVLRRARWSEVQEWRRELLLYAHRGDPERLAETVCTPGAIITVLERLAQEGVLRRRQATRIAEALLQCLDAQGHWK